MDQSFCPDNGLECTPLVAQGGHCELDRDDECAGGAFAICLNYICVIKGVPIGGFCGVESYVTSRAVSFLLRQPINLYSARVPISLELSSITQSRLVKK